MAERKIIRVIVEGRERYFTREGKEIGILDMDGVLAHLLPAWFDLYNLEYEDTLTGEQVHSWNFPQYVKKECGDKIFDYFKRPGLFRNLQPIEQAGEVLERMSERYEFYIVSDSPEGHAHGMSDEFGGVSNPADDKRQWIKEHFPFLKPQNMIFTSAKYMVCGSFLLDDGPPNLNDWHNLGRIAIGMNQNYGWSKEILPCIPQIKGWDELEAVVNRLLPPYHP